MASTNTLGTSDSGVKSAGSPSGFFLKTASFQTEHIVWSIPVAFDTVVRRLETQLGKFDYSVYKAFAGAHVDKTEIETKINAMAGSSGLMLFEKQNHGGLLSLVDTPKRGIQYVVGNPLIAIQMTRHDIRAGLYAPLRLFVWSKQSETTTIEYDLPSSLFGQFGEPEINQVALGLDEKLARLVHGVSDSAQDNVA